MVSLRNNVSSQLYSWSQFILPLILSLLSRLPRWLAVSDVVVNALSWKNFYSFSVWVSQEIVCAGFIIACDLFIFLKCIRIWKALVHWAIREIVRFRHCTSIFTVARLEYVRRSSLMKHERLSWHSTLVRKRTCCTSISPLHLWAGWSYYYHLWAMSVWNVFRVDEL